MKWIFVFTCFIVFSSKPAMAQSEFAPIGATWYYNQYCFCPDVYYQKFVSLKDTMLTGINCRKVGVLTAIDYVQVDTFYSFFYFYSDSNAVYYFFENQFHLLYDFSKEAGDTFYVKAPDSFNDTLIPIKVLSKSDTSINEITLRKLSIHSLLPEWAFEGTTIEKIGCESYLLPYFAAIDPVPGPLRCYSDSSFGLYINPWYANSMLPCD